MQCFLGEESCVFLVCFHYLPGMHCVACHNECTVRWLPVNGIHLTAFQVHSQCFLTVGRLGRGLLSTDAEAQSVLSMVFPHPYKCDFGDYKVT